MHHSRCTNLALLGTTVEPAAARIVLWSGSFAGSGDPATAAASNPLNWTAAAWTSLDITVHRWVDSGRSGNLLVRTHAAHIVSDAPSALRFARTWREHGVRLVYDPVSMLTREQVGGPAAAELYLRRIEALANPELSVAIEFVLIANAAVRDVSVLPVPVEGGELDPAIVLRAAALCAELGIATAVLETDLGAFGDPATR